MAAIDTTPRMRGLLGLALERVLETILGGRRFPSMLEDAQNGQDTAA